MATKRQFEALETLANELSDFQELRKLAVQLYHHHASQAKSVSGPVTRQYNADLANRLAHFLDLPQVVPGRLIR